MNDERSVEQMNQVGNILSRMNNLQFMQFLRDEPWISEFERRRAAGSIFRANNGNYYLKRCPLCGCEIVVDCVECDLSEDELKNLHLNGKWEDYRKSDSYLSSYLYDGFKPWHPGTYYKFRCDCHEGFWEDNYERGYRLFEEFVAEQ